MTHTKKTKKSSQRLKMMSTGANSYNSNENQIISVRGGPISVGTTPYFVGTGWALLAPLARWHQKIRRNFQFFRSSCHFSSPQKTHSCYTLDATTSSPACSNTHVVGIPKRTIKFRAWGRYGEWDENLDCRKWQMIDGDSLCFEEFKPVCDLLESKEDEEYFMQYINRNDIKGKEIYECDIVKWGHIKGGEENPIRIAVVVLDPDIQFHIVNYKMDFLGQNKVFHYGSFIYTDTEKWLEVIGNVFENPELLG